MKELFARPEEDFAVIREALKILGPGGLSKMARCNMLEKEKIDRFCRGFTSVKPSEKAKLLKVLVGATVCECNRLMDRALIRYLDPKMPREPIDDEKCPIYPTLTQEDRLVMISWHEQEKDPDRAKKLGTQIIAVGKKLLKHNQ